MERKNCHITMDKLKIDKYDKYDMLFILVGARVIEHTYVVSDVTASLRFSGSEWNNCNQRTTQYR
jgi:hypothetical protein